MAIENYMPDFAVEAVYDLTVPSLQAQGIKAVLVDLDNTLIAWNNPDGTPEMKQWLHDLRDAGIRIIVVSNNTKKRVQRAVEKFGIDYVYWALKPFTFGIDRAMKEFHYEKSEVVMVGDQLMTDIRAAHRAGIRSIFSQTLGPTRLDQKRRLTELASVMSCEKSLKSTDQSHIKKEFNYGRNSLYWLWSNHSDNRQGWSWIYPPVGT